MRRLVAQSNTNNVNDHISSPNTQRGHHTQSTSRQPCDRRSVVVGYVLIRESSLLHTPEGRKARPATSTQVSTKESRDGFNRIVVAEYRTDAEHPFQTNESNGPTLFPSLVGRIRSLSSLVKGFKRRTMISSRPHV